MGIKEKKEEVQPQESQTPKPSAFETSMAEMVRKQEEDLARQRTERDKLQQEIASARDAEGSFVANWFKANEPKFDANAEKRAQQAARIKAIGEALGLVASGFAAFGKNGMGYVPKFESSALKDIEKINETREKYLAQKEAWKEFDYKQRLAKLQADTKAAEALKSAKDKDIDAGEKTLSRYQEMMQKHQSEKEIAAIKAEQALEKQSQGHAQKLEQIGKRTEGAIAEQNAKDAKKAEENTALEYAAIADLVSPPENVVETVENEGKYDEKRTTRTSTARLSRAENIKRGEAFKASWQGRLYDKYKELGGTTEEYLKALPEVEKTVNDLVKSGNYTYNEAVEEVLKYISNE